MPLSLKPLTIKAHPDDSVAIVVNSGGLPAGTVGTKNLLAITQTVQCVAGVVDQVVKRIKAELPPTCWCAPAPR